MQVFFLCWYGCLIQDRSIERKRNLKSKTQPGFDMLKT
ncbi:hypothetical protein RintRC_4825 [Richelia intracellularis]|nr:hypothetical protein RintRC_4825 [Richelia intracellularis]